MIFSILNDIDIVSYVDNSTLYKVYDNVDAFILTFRISAKKLFKQFNQIKSNLRKMMLSHLMLSRRDLIFI